MAEAGAEWDFSAHEAQVLSEIPRRLEPLKPRRVVLFGSRALGTAARDSDYDLLVVMDVPDRSTPRAVPVRRLLRGMGVPFDIIVYTPEEWEAFRVHPQALAHHIARTGRALYESP